MFIHPIKGSPDRAVEFLFGTVVIGAAGAISSQDCLGFSVAKEVAAGTYTVTLDRDVQRLLFVSAQLFLDGPADQTINVGEQNFDVSPQNLVFEIYDVSGGTVGDISSGSAIHIMLVVSRSGLPRTGA